MYEGQPRKRKTVWSSLRFTDYLHVLIYVSFADVTFANPVAGGTSQLLMDVIYDWQLDSLRDEDTKLIYGLNAMSEVQQLAVTGKATIRLSAYVSFDKSIALDDEGSFVIGPLFALLQKNHNGWLDRFG